MVQQVFRQIWTGAGWVRRLEGECITEMRLQKRTNETAENLHVVSCLKKTKLPAFVDLVLQFSRGWWPCTGMQKVESGQSFCWTRHSFSLSCWSTCLQVQALLSNMGGDPRWLKVFCTVPHVWWVGPLVVSWGPGQPLCMEQQWVIVQTGPAIITVLCKHDKKAHFMLVCI